MKRLFLSFVLCFGFVGSAVAMDDDLYLKLKSDSPNFFTSKEFKTFCSAKSEQNAIICYGYIRGLVWGYSRGHIAAHHGRGNLCIPVYDETTIHELTIKVVNRISGNVDGNFYIPDSAMDFVAIEKVLSSAEFCDQPHY